MSDSNELTRLWDKHRAEMRQLALDHSKALNKTDAVRIASILENILDDPESTIGELTAFVEGERIGAINVCYPEETASAD